MSIMGAPPPVVSRKPHAGPDRGPPGCKVKGFWRPLHVQEELPTGLGLAPVRPCLQPSPPRLDPSLGIRAPGTTPRPEATSPALPTSTRRSRPPRADPPAPGGRLGDVERGTRHRARTLARAAPGPGSPRRSALCRPAEARAG